MRFLPYHDLLVKQARLNKRCGFTLVEIMIVIAIMGVILATSIPMVWRALNKNELAKAVTDIMEGCKAARDRAILHGTPYHFVIHNEGKLDVVEMPKPQRPGVFGSGISGGAQRSSQVTGSLMGAFPRKLGENVIIQLVDVNFVDHMGLEEARVRFYPNGTSDEFTIVLNDKGIQRTITVDIITGLPQEITR